MLLDRKTVSIPRACELVGVSRRTIYNWIASGKVQYVRTAGGSVRIYADTLWREPEPIVAEPAHEVWQDPLRRGA
jgi:excisionase family DNA binding protein